MTLVEGKLLLLRHGASVWNEKNLFTGWIDIPLSAQGMQESYQAGKELANLSIDVIFTSDLMRAQMTMLLAMQSHPSGKTAYFISEDSLNKCYSEKTTQELIPVYKAWELNERMYGELQGKNKKEVADQFGEAQVKIWRRSFDVAPPQGESLKMTSERVLPYFQEKVMPLIKQGKTVLIVAHGNSLRSLVMMLEKLSSEDVIQLEIPTGGILSYHYHQGVWVRDER
ncbi:MAG: histidine phosphatase family protein [Candidatus Rhabdochlamydia sp.]